MTSAANLDHSVIQDVVNNVRDAFQVRIKIVQLKVLFFNFIYLVKIQVLLIEKSEPYYSKYS